MTSVSTQRFIGLAGTLNTRDLGGLPLKSGGVTAGGVFLRSDVPMDLPENDLRLLDELGLSTVIDLRQPHELERDPSSLEGRRGTDWHHVNVWDLIEERHRPRDRFDLSAIYLAALDNAGPAFAESVSILAGSAGAGLFHCTAGKDRTGLLALLLLQVAGVPDEAIIADFALTHDRIDPLRQRLMRDAAEQGLDTKEYARLLDATPDLLEPAVKHLNEQYGGAGAYLAGHGVSARVLERVKERLTGG